MLRKGKFPQMIHKYLPDWALCHPVEDTIFLRKHEIRNPKFETNPNDQKTNDQNKDKRLRQKNVFVLNFELLNLFRISCFVLRIYYSIRVSPFF